MTRRIGWLAAVTVLMAYATAQAIPPPRMMEKDKAAADLIIIAKTTTASIVQNAAPGGYREMRIGLEPIEVLKGKLPEKDGKKLQLAMLYLQRRPAGGGPVVPMVDGGGQPKPANGETALIFLVQRPPEASFFSAAGSAFGYISLEVATKADLDKLKRHIGWSRKFCEKLNKTDRKAMNGYYDKAILVASKLLATSWQLVAGKFPAYISSKAKEQVVRGTLVVKNVGKRLEYRVKTSASTFRLNPPTDGIFRPLDGKLIEVKCKMQPRGEIKRRSLLVGWVREVVPPAPPSKPKPKVRPARI